jgi:hypothetical protein
MPAARPNPPDPCAAAYRRWMAYAPLPPRHQTGRITPSGHGSYTAPRVLLSLSKRHRGTPFYTRVVARNLCFSGIILPISPQLPTIHFAKIDAWRGTGATPSRARSATCRSKLHDSGLRVLEASCERGKAADNFLCQVTHNDAQKCGRPRESAAVAGTSDVLTVIPKRNRCGSCHQPLNLFDNSRFYVVFPTPSPTTIRRRIGRAATFSHNCNDTMRGHIRPGASPQRQRIVARVPMAAMRRSTRAPVLRKDEPTAK